MNFKQVEEILKKEYKIDLTERTLRENEVATLVHNIVKKHYENEAIRIMQYYDGVENNPRKIEEQGKLT